MAAKNRSTYALHCQLLMLMRNPAFRDLPAIQDLLHASALRLTELEIQLRNTKEKLPIFQ